MKRILFTLTLLFPYIMQGKGLDERIDEGFAPVSNFFSEIIFFKINEIPFVLMLLVFSALFFTIYFVFPNIRYFKVAINTVRGKYDDLEGGYTNNDDIKGTIKDESQDGEVTHFQALATAVSGTVGNGNIAGVALAIALGGPGATFWMIICGLLGMSTKFVECTLGVKYRDVGEDGTVYGGPMYYISKGLKERGFAFFGKISAILIAILIGLIFGIISALNKGNTIDVLIQFISTIGMSVPSFFSAIIFAWIFGFLL